MLPARGAYAAFIDELGMRNEEYNKPSSIINHQSSMLNIGSRPTIGNGADVSIEAHLFDFHGDLYGKTLTISFLARLRDEQRFESEEELIRQLERDREACLKAPYGPPRGTTEN
jgi:riboflavin kinase/FMN adenylyltransferase